MYQLHRAQNYIAEQKNTQTNKNSKKKKNSYNIHHMLSRVWLFMTLMARLLCPWDFPGKKSGVDCHFLLQGISPTQRLNPSLLHGSSVQFSRSVVSNSLQPHEPQHGGPPCPSPTPRVYPNSCTLSRWCHPAISSSVIPFSSCPQSLPASEFFPVSQFFAWGGQSIGVSALASVFPMNTQDWSPLGWTGWIFLQSEGLSRVFSSTTVLKHQFFGTQLSSQSNSHIHTWPQEKP